MVYNKVWEQIGQGRRGSDIAEEVLAAARERTDKIYAQFRALKNPYTEAERVFERVEQIAASGVPEEVLPEIAEIVAVNPEVWPLIVAAAPYIAAALTITAVGYGAAKAGQAWSKPSTPGQSPPKPPVTPPQGPITYDPGPGLVIIPKGPKFIDPRKR